MKTLLITVALFFASLSFTNAQTVADETSVAQTVAVADEFKEVQLDALNEKVKAAIQAKMEANDVKAIYFNEQTKVTKVILVSKADQKETTILLNEEGVEA